MLLFDVYVKVNASLEFFREMAAAFRMEWTRIPRYLLRNLYGSMRRRLDAVIASRGGHTRY